MTDDIKQVLVIRTHYPDGKGGLYKPRWGKLAAQAAHASLKVFLDCSEIFQGEEGASVVLHVTPVQLKWLTGAFTKICVGCRSEEELRLIYEQARAAVLPCSLVIDSGRTEFHGVPTPTVVAVGPDYASKIDTVTGSLTLL